MARGHGIGSRVVTVEFNSGHFVPVNGPFRACLNGSGLCPPMGLGLGPSTARCIGPALSLIHISETTRLLSNT